MTDGDNGRSGMLGRQRKWFCQFISPPVYGQSHLCISDGVGCCGRKVVTHPFATSFDEEHRSGCCNRPKILPFFIKNATHFIVQLLMATLALRMLLR